jgi:hypothetical protein
MLETKKAMWNWESGEDERKLRELIREKSFSIDQAYEITRLIRVYIHHILS